MKSILRKLREKLRSKRASTPSPPSSAPIVHIELAPFVSLATQQAGMELVRGLRVENPTPEDLTGVELQVAFDPKFASGRTWRIPAVAAGKTMTIDDHQVRLSGGYLASVTAIRVRRMW